MYTATQWSTIEDKQKFKRDLIRFIESGFKRTLFYKALYSRLSMCFQHIAHYNINGFYAVWFSTQEDQARWIEHVKTITIYGDPAWTFSDVERDIQKYLRGLTS